MDTGLSTLSNVAKMVFEITIDPHRDTSLSDSSRQPKSGQTHVVCTTKKQKQTQTQTNRIKNIENSNLNFYFISCHRKCNGQGYAKGEKYMKLIPLKVKKE